MSEFRRKMMASPNENKGKYIQDGLMMHLDCLDTANCRNNYWHSTVGDYTFTGNATYTVNGFQFNGSNTYLRMPENTGLFHRLPNMYNCTIEVVYEIPSIGTRWGVVFADGDWYDTFLAVTYSTDNLVSCWAYKPDSGKSATTNGGTFLVNTNKTARAISESYSGKNADNKIGYCNTVALTSKKGNGYWTIASHMGHCMIIGARLTSHSQQVPVSGFFTGLIKAIRYYNRALTAEEILHNQNIDSIRYNLGI